MQIRWTRTVAMTLLITLLLAVSIQAKTMYVEQTAKLYKNYNANSKVLMSLASDTKVNVLATKKGWAKVKVSGKRGYIKATLLTSAKPGSGSTSNEQDETLYVETKTKLFKSTSASSKCVAVLPQGAAVTLKLKKGKWAKVTYNRKSGFVKLANLSAKPVDADDDPAPVTPPANEPSSKYETLKPGDSGDSVKQLQTRLKKLEWFYGDIGGNYKTLTTQAVKDFQEAVGLKVTGIAYPETQTALYKSNAPSNVLESTASPASGKAQEMDWWTSNIQSIYPRGSTAVVTDVETGLTWREYRSGGTNHADVQPKTASDTAVLKKVYGGTWSWNRRAVWVSIGGKKYAASMNGMPHGSGSITTNNFSGHHCLHFTNSRTHGSNSLDAMHQAAIKHAAAAS